jgi:Cysteine rich repeat
MSWFGRLFGIVIALAGIQQAVAKNRLTDPLKVARECKSEIELFCKGTRPGGKRIIICLKQKLVELSPTCSIALQSAE